MLKIVIIALLLSTGSMAYSDGNLKKGLRPIEFERPIKICKALPDEELHTSIAHTLSMAQKQFNCGQVEASLKLLTQAQDDMIYYLENQAMAATGNCFSKDNCGRPKLGGGWVTKAECELAGGESWQQVNPTKGACIDL